MKNVNDELGVLKILPVPVSEEAEMYFIQYWFCVNRDLLRRDFRELYDAMFQRYLPIYEQGRAAKVDLGEINKKFERSMTGEKPAKKKKNK